jgi:hypothetical protein
MKTKDCLVPKQLGHIITMQVATATLLHSSHQYRSGDQQPLFPTIQTTEWQSETGHTYQQRDRIKMCQVSKSMYGRHVKYTKGHIGNSQTAPSRHQPARKCNKLNTLKTAVWQLTLHQWKQLRQMCPGHVCVAKHRAQCVHDERLASFKHRGLGPRLCIAANHEYHTGTRTAFKAQGEYTTH